MVAAATLFAGGARLLCIGSRLRNGTFVVLGCRRLSAGFGFDRCWPVMLAREQIFNDRSLVCHRICQLRGTVLLRIHDVDGCGLAGSAANVWDNDLVRSVYSWSD